MMRLTDLGSITVDPDIKEHIEDLIVKLFYQNRLQLEHGMKRKLHFAKELMEMELRR